MSINFESSKLIIGSCGASTNIRIKSVGVPIHHRKVKVTKRTVIPAHSRQTVPVEFKLFTHDRDVNFRPLYSQSSSYLAHAGAFLEAVCANTMSTVLYHTTSDRPVIIARNTSVGEMVDFEPDTECHLLDLETIELWGEALFGSAERHTPSFNRISSATGFHLSAEAFAGIGDRVPKAMEEKVADAMGESILDDIGPGEITSSIEDIKFGPDLLPHQLQELKELVKRHRCHGPSREATLNALWTNSRA
jgi:hypothetical protein